MVIEWNGTVLEIRRKADDESKVVVMPLGKVVAMIRGPGLERDLILQENQKPHMQIPLFECERWLFQMEANMKAFGWVGIPGRGV